MNLLDLSACAVPAGFQADGLPFGVTLLAPAYFDRCLLQLADPLQRALSPEQGVTELELPGAQPLQTSRVDRVTVVVAGAHMEGLPLNHQITDRGGHLLERTITSEHYRLYALPGGPPHRPGLVRVDKGNAIEVELWSLPMVNYGSFVAGIPEPLGIGTIKLADGRKEQGFLCEHIATRQATDISDFGGWRAYVERDR
jgi:allophanate hydrolase